MSDSPAHQSRSQQLMALADQCVKCGLCLPHCPTYRETEDESEGPRGRISLLQGLALNALEPTPALAGHIDRCLGCRACEAACPAKVRYSEILQLGRAELADRGALRPTWVGRLGYRLPSHRRLLKGASWALFAYQRSGLQTVAKRLRLPQRLGLARADTYLPQPLLAPTKPKPFHPARGKRRGGVALFTGCTGEALAAGTLASAITLLTRLGYDVHVPQSQGCCGALNAHAGQTGAAAALRRRNLAAFAEPDIDHIIHFASGCGAELKSYASDEAPEAGARFASKS
ncbi:(Fe-S)-binding protein [Alkalilimnicola ehrlichii]|uniref:4Fe-4S ferredoxin-type domain-containing protein n=1 Tax=Alkalilimnicola ehrlichii TaxID=351052 RepID=A0A3E0X372_9GAMM|nr:4Fe-4S dicluster domain-containing protein [Alkalilimnicola ehrlichii]RFA39488.1 hypothetical protein CAL65_01520 [Alkalilimnicola ehrlichii]